MYVCTLRTEPCELLLLLRVDLRATNEQQQQHTHAARSPKRFLAGLPFRGMAMDWMECALNDAQVTAAAADPSTEM